MKQTIVRLLCALLLLSTLFAVVACNDTDSTPKETLDGAQNGGLDEDDPWSNYLSEIGVRNYQGREFLIATRNTDSKSFFTLHPDGEGYKGYSVSDAMYTRDLELESEYGILISYMLYADNDNGQELASKVGNAELGGLHLCDMVVSNLNSSINTLQTQKVLSNIEELPVVNKETPWWASYFWDNISYNGSLYFTAGQAAGGGFFATPYVMICNLKMAEDVAMQNGATLDMFDMVNAGEWTLENFEYIIRDYTTNLDSDEAISVYYDKLAYAHCRSDVTAYAHFVGAGMSLSTVDANGKITVDLGETTGSMVTRLSNLFASIEDNFNQYAYFKEKPSQQILAFKQDRALFFGNSISYVDEITDMGSDYAIIPCPKASVEQQSYYAGVNTWTPGYIAFPRLCGEGDTDFVGYTAELMGYLSYVYVKPEVYDKMLCLRLAKDKRQIRIMDDIYDSLYVDLNMINDFATSASHIAGCIMDSKKNFSSGKASIDSVLDLVIGKFEKDMKK